ncbi:hypothetical protein [uncultured Desulfobacter sp.]|uniref:hypothetical protein n=1 Tax=uncultured Desulfobacter sp. TaxID=240139 RepID=UPI0029F4CEBF|nr:hypothetical protein [uncultured Desulfobacter sp.]
MTTKFPSSLFSSFRLIILSFAVTFFLVGSSLFSPAISDAGTANADIANIWTGLQQEGNQFCRVTLKIDTITAPNKPLSGSLTVEPANVGVKRAPEPQTAAINGTFFYEISLIKMQYQLRRGRRYEVFGVLNPEKNRMALIYEGRTGDGMLPVYLTAGPTLPKELQPFAVSRIEAADFRKEKDNTAAELTAIQNRSQVINEQIMDAQNRLRDARHAHDKETVNRIKKELEVLAQSRVQERQKQQELIMAQARKARELQIKQMENENPELAAVEKQMLDLQARIVAVSKTRDMPKLRELSQQIKALKQQRSMLMRNRHAAPVVAPGASADHSCPEDLLAWAGELEKNGASAARFHSITQLANLFRPSVFNTYFKTGLLSMAPNHRRELGIALQRGCTRLDTAFSRGSNIMTVAKGFDDQGFQLNYLSAAIAGETLDTVHEWLEWTLGDLDDSDTLSGLNLLDKQGKTVMAALWPNETKMAENKIAQTGSQSAAKVLTAQIDRLTRHVENLETLNDLARLRKNEIWKKLTPRDQKQLVLYYNEQADGPVARYLTSTFPQTAVDKNAPRNALAAGKQWYESQNTLFSQFSDTKTIKEFNRRFPAQREDLFKQILPDLKKEIAACQSTQEVKQFGRAFTLPMDSRNQTCKAIEALKVKQIAALDHQTFVARVGSGPFKPDHPGAVYLNALYRNDWETITQEDRAFALPVARMMEPMNNSGIYDLVAAFSGGQVKGQQLKNYMQQKMENATMCTSMAGFYVISLEYISPNCLGPNPVEIERIREWDEVLVNGYGTELSRIPHSETRYYTIARRHREIFDKIKDPANAESLEFINKLLGGFGMKKEGVRTSMEKLSSNLKGLGKAMNELPCDGEVMQKIEAALLKKASEQ